MTGSRFDDLTAALAETRAAGAAAAALFDYQTGESWACDGGRWFHAASTIKIAVLACVYASLRERGLAPWHRLNVRNRFFSAADGTPYEIVAARDSDAEVHRRVGRRMRVGDLARHMITVSSNLATNVLLDFVGVATAQRILSDAGISGVHLVRGVEDERAFDAGVSNMVTASGLIALLRAILEGRFSDREHTDEMLDILSAQAFNSGIPAGLPPAIRATARVAHKTGEISTVTHDAGIVFLPGRPPYALAVLTETGAEGAQRFAPIARLSALAFERLAYAGRRLEGDGSTHAAPAAEWKP